MEQPLSSLNLPRYILKELRALGYNTCADFLSADEKIKNKYPKIQKLFEAPSTSTALDCYQNECLLGCIPTLLKPLDEILDGGVPVGLITEIAGDVDVRKTELCYRLCTNVQLPIWCGGVQGRAVFIGTNKNFGVHRLQEVAHICFSKYCALRDQTEKQDDDFSVGRIMENIEYVNVKDVFELIAAVKYLSRWFEENKNIKLVVIDTISAPFKQTTLDNRKHLYGILSDLQKLACEHGFAVVLTNELATKVNKEGAYLVPALGEVYYHCVNVRIELKRVTSSLVRGYLRKSSGHKSSSFELFM